MMDSEYIKWFEEIGKEDTPTVGGKTANLGELMKIDMPVPDGFGVTTSSYNEFIEKSGIKDEVNSLLKQAHENLSDLNRIEEISDQIKETINNAEIPKEIREVIIPAFKQLINDIEVIDAIAIRSSSVQEDMDDASFAGQYETVLNVKNEQEFLDGIKECWASLFGPRLIQYRAKMDIGHEQAEIAVAVQQMLTPECSGVMFTLNPTTGDKNELLIEATWGQGESIVSGSVNPDNILVKKSNLSIKKMDIGSKETMTVCTPEGGVVEENVSEEKKSTCCVKQKEVQYLGELGKKIEKHYGTPQDIEWAIVDGIEFPDNIFILQCRAETVWSQKKEKKEKSKKSELADKVSTDFTF